jgi:hypothetical protein
MNEKTLLYQLTETSRFMMGFVIVTKNDNVIIIDGGRSEDMPLLKEYVGNRRISAWILTHAHNDHITGFISEWQKNKLADFNLERVYYNFPPYHQLKGRKDVPDEGYFNRELDEILPEFLELEPELGDRGVVVKQGDSLLIDECRIDFIFSFHDGLFSNLMNDSSLVFSVTTPNKRVLFLGDLGPEGGDVLYEESRDKLKADIVQMAHHGHMNVGMEVYAAIAPEACLWCCPDWLYDEPEIPPYLENRKRLRKMQRERMYGTAVTRKWMEILGVKKHYVTKDGTNVIEI